MPLYTRTITKALQAIACITAKMKESPLQPVEHPPLPFEDVHYDISGPFAESFEGHRYVAHFI